MKINSIILKINAINNVMLEKKLINIISEYLKLK